jgi:hypothetical protein
MALSWRSGNPCTTESAATAADTIAVRVPVPEALEEMRTAVDEMVLVSDERLALLRVPAAGGGRSLLVCSPGHRGRSRHVRAIQPPR